MVPPYLWGGSVTTPDTNTTYTAGAGLSLSSTEFSVNVDDSSIEVNGSDNLQVKASGVTNAMLAGSIANSKLSNSSITINDTAVSLGGSISITDTNTTYTAGAGLTLGETEFSVNVDDSSIEVNGSDNLQVKASGVTNAMLAGSIANSKLSNSSITINGAAISLGGSVTTPDTNTTYTAGSGLSLSSTEFSISATQTTLTSIKHNSLIIGGNSQNNTIDFGTDDAIIFDIDNSEKLRVNSSGITYPAADDGQIFSLDVHASDESVGNGYSTFRISEASYGEFCYFEGAVTTSSDMTFFTGQHGCIPNDTTIQTNISDYIGLIVSSSGSYNSVNLSNEQSLTGKSGITINNSLPIVALSTIQQDKKVFGVISASEDPSGNSRIYGPGPFKRNRNRPDTRLFINSVGEGAIWVTDYNGNLDNGDYITTSPITGYGMKQNDDILRNYTVAKITMDCNFDTSGTNYTCETFTHNGTSYKKAFVGCTYHCG